MLKINIDIKKIDFSKADQVRLISKTQAKEMYQLMKDVHELFEKHQITYWAVGGTLLGAIRHQGIIPWDDDMDIGIDEKEVYKLINLSFELKKLGYELDTSRFFYKIQAINGKLDTCKDVCDWSIKIRSPWLDIFPYKAENDRYVHANEIVRSWWSKDIYAPDSIKQRILAPFGSFKIHIPSNSGEYLTNYYGADALTHGYYEGLHEGKINPTDKEPIVEWQLQPQDKLPAIFDGVLENRIH